MSKAKWCMFWAAVLLFFPLRVFGAETEFRIENSSDGKMWTVVQDLREGKREDGTPWYWYNTGTRAMTGKVSGIRALKKGEHYYWYNRKGEIPVGEWKVEEKHSYCVSGWTEKSAEEQGISYGNRYSCRQSYFSGWMAYCADCKGVILEGNIHMSYEAAKSLDTVDVDKGYYYLCPSIVSVYDGEEAGENRTLRYARCGHLDKQWGPAPHRCREISYNRYRIVYDANGEAAGGRMEPSFHMYGNEEYYEGNKVTPVNTLSLCTFDRTKEGYLFAGWNTRPDGTGQFYGDGAVIYNLSSENYDAGTDAGTVTLYAQWEPARSNLKIDPGDGVYHGEDIISRSWGSSWKADPSLLAAPLGYRVLFHADGGKMDRPMVMGTRSFLGWELAEPANGELRGIIYRFTGADGTMDTLRAVYGLDPVQLPTPVKKDYSFGGWYLDPGCTELAGHGGDFYVPNESTHMYAKWVDLKLTAVPDYSSNRGKGAVSLNWEQNDGVSKVYRIFGREEGQEEFGQILAGEDAYGRVMEEQYFGCERRTRSVVVPSAGFYLLKAEGAQGENYGACKGGQGGSAEGFFYLEQGEEIHVAVGGQDGYNGGGAASKFGRGGGCTVVSSNLKGILLIAGGGGGATSSRDGLQGGSTITYTLGTGIQGESGMSGGGGGCAGGKAGTGIVHKHSVEGGCYRDSAFNAFDAEYAIAPVARQWKDEESRPDGSHVRSDRYFSSQIGSAGNLIPVNGNKTLEIGAWIYAAGTNLISGNSYIQVADQNGVPFFTSTIRKLRQEWNAFQERVILPSGSSAYKGWPPVANVVSSTTWSKDHPGGDYTILNEYDIYYPVFYADQTARAARAILDPEYKNPFFYGSYADEYYPPRVLWHSSILSRRGYGDRPLLFEERSFWYGTSGAHFQHKIDIPEGTTGIYVYAEGMMDAIELHNGEKILKPVGDCTVYFDRIVLSGGRMLDCKALDVHIPARGGSSFINYNYALASSSEAGSRTGNGSVLMRAEMAGLADGQNMKWVDAPDRAAPYAVDRESIVMKAAGDHAIEIYFDKAEDRGTRYLFKAESYSSLTGGKVCDSNIAQCLVKTGVKGYYYRTDTSSRTRIGGVDEKEYMLLAPGDRKIRVKTGEEVRYLHIAAVDHAGNISETTHVKIDARNVDVAWEISTEKLSVSSVVGDADYENVSPGPGENTYYVRADGCSPFLLSYRSFMHGPARKDYQINHQVIDLCMKGQAQKHGAVLPYSEHLYSAHRLDVSEFRQWSEGAGILTDALYTGAERSSGARELSYFRAFIMPAALHGKTVVATPVAGAAWGNEIRYSDWTNDLANGARLIGDGKGPVITGLEILEGLELIDRGKNTVVLEVDAADDLSGVGRFYIEIKNKDNHLQKRYLPEGDGKIRVDITGAEPVFSGDFTVAAYAEDRVGNVTAVDYGVTEFALMATAQRILEPHDPVFKRGESGILEIEVWGYAQKVEVEFPEFLSGYSRTFVYEDSPEYKKTETIQFMIPLDAAADSCEITVRAYKGDRKLEKHPVISTVEIGGSVLDELRTRLR